MSRALLSVGDRQSRRLVRPLTDRGLLTVSKDAPLRIAFPLGESERLFPPVSGRQPASP
jgi:hypothetical protein